MKVSITLAACLLSAAVPAAEPETDPNTGLVIAPGWETAAAHCGACHSHALVTAQRGDAEFWLSTIRWMQKTQNLWQIPPAQEDTLIRYLETNYNETDWGRRPPLPQSLMPGAP
jgi:mono/diheme cytochrome c family protein